jgi:hypothetical protein
MFSNHTQPTALAVGTLAALPDLNAIALQCGLIVRQNEKFSAEGLLLTLFKAISTGNASFSQMAASLGECEVRTLSRQALHQRMKPEVIGFLEAVLKHVGLSSLNMKEADGSYPFRRIILEDSTQMRMHPKNHPSFRAVANNSGVTSGAKIDVIMDLVSGELLRQKETQGYVQDRSLGPELLPMITEGDLVLRDMGYFDVSSFAYIESQSAYWLSRLHGQANVRLLNGTTLEELLSRTTKNSIEIEVTLTEQKHRARLIAVRSKTEVASRRRQKKKDKRRRNGTQASKRSLQREDWDILITNIPEEKCGLDELVRLYRQRWEIEIHFRAWKQSLEMHRALNRITSHVHLHALILTAMIFSALAIKIQKWVQKWKPRIEISEEKLFTWLSGRLRILRSLKSEIPIDLRHISRCKRKRSSLHQRGCGLRPLN